MRDGIELNVRPEGAAILMGGTQRRWLRLSVGRNTYSVNVILQTRALFYLACDVMGCDLPFMDEVWSEPVGPTLHSTRDPLSTSPVPTQCHQ